MKLAVPIGPATLAGYGVALLGIAGTIVSAAGTNLHLSTQSIAILTAAITFGTNFLRSWQAREKIKASKVTKVTN